MKEKNPQTQERLCGPGGSGSIFDEFEESANMATVVNGMFDEYLPIANSTVAEVRANHRDRLGISPGTTAYLDGVEVSEDTVIRANQTLSFQTLSGIKGLAA